MVEAAENMAAFFAKRLYKSMKGAGTNDTQLIRIVVSRSEVSYTDTYGSFGVQQFDVGNVNARQFFNSSCLERM